MSDLEFKVQDGIATITFDSQGKRVNILTSSAQEALVGLLDRAEKDSGIKALFFQSGKPHHFIAGADIKEIEGIRNAAKGEEKSKLGQAMMNRIEDLPFPTVALINGVCLGGGLELSLACTYRFAASNDAVRIGLPEVRPSFHR